MSLAKNKNLILRNDLTGEAFSESGKAGLVNRAAFE
jgi:hypothetical protein